jgi:hypothetical protein
MDDQEEVEGGSDQDNNGEGEEGAGESSRSPNQDSQSLEANSLEQQIPRHLKCPYGEHLLQDAVLIPCCGHFVCCDVCIREKISNDEMVECPNEACDQEIGSMASITPYHEMRRKVSDYLSMEQAKARQATKQQQQQQQQASLSNDPLFDMILSGVVNESASNVSASESSLQAKQVFLFWTIPTSTNITKNNLFLFFISF